MNESGKEVNIFNTLSGKVEVFKPLKEGVVTMYNCGPTVYDYAHIGNLRAYIFADTLRRMFEWNGYKVTQVINVTDIGHLSSDADDGEDKMTRALKREGKPFTLKAMREVADFYFEKFKEDLEKLNIELPSKFPFASDHIEEDIELIKRLEENGFVYKTSDGLYFDTSRMKDYGKLGGSASSDHSRIGVNSEKKDGRDFALWKFNQELGYSAPWGNGFPGWHIECSAMSMKYLGETFDIHTGGVDHISVHHNNEIAQSESVSGKPLANYWMHNEHMQINEDKMSKSAGNFLKLNNLIEEGYDPLAYRYLILLSSYRTKSNFTFEALKNASNSLKKIYSEFSSLGGENGAPIKEALDSFTAKINDDLNTPLALAEVFSVINGKDNYANYSEADRKATILEFDKVLGLKILENSQKYKKDSEEVPIAIKNLVSERELARKNKQFDRSDMLRNEINELGYIVEDSDSGPKISKKH